MVSNNLDRTARFQLVQKRKHITLNSYHEAGCEWWMWNLRACVCKKEGPQALDLPGWRDHIPIVWCHETCQNLTLILTYPQKLKLNQIRAPSHIFHVGCALIPTELATSPPLQRKKKWKRSRSSS